MKIDQAIETAANLFAEAHQDGYWTSLGMPERGDVNAQTQFGDLIVRAWSTSDHAIYFDGQQYTTVGDVNGLVGFRFR